MTCFVLFGLLFFFSSRRRHTRCALVTGVQTCALPISLGDLVDDGYDPALVYSITGSDDDLAMDAEKLQREEDTTSGFLSDEDNIDEAGRMVTVYESYIRIDAEGTGRRQLWKVVHVGHTLLEKQKVTDHPLDRKSTRLNSSH